MTEDIYTKTIGGTYSQEYLLHINSETHGTVQKHPNTDVFTDTCQYCPDE